jgi:hypothetical protein
MDIFQPVTIARIVFILGIINLVSGMLIFMSCRCTPGSRIVTRLTGNLMQYSAYKRFFSYHCYFWWILLPSVIAHAIFAFAIIGIPF